MSSRSSDRSHQLVRACFVVGIAVLAATGLALTPMSAAWIAPLAAPAAGPEPSPSEARRVAAASGRPVARTADCPDLMRAEARTAARRRPTRLGVGLMRRRGHNSFAWAPVLIP